MRNTKAKQSHAPAPNSARPSSGLTSSVWAGLAKLEKILGILWAVPATFGRECRKNPDSGAIVAAGIQVTIIPIPAIRLSEGNENEKCFGCSA
jgi:hypothetical protein